MNEIKSPQELLLYMKENISYGFVSKADHKIYLKENDIDKYFSDEYFLQTPDEVIKNKCGVCWDMVELERDWFMWNNYKFKTFFLTFTDASLENLPTHTFLAYKENEQWCWFEHSFYSHRGIHEYSNLNDLIEDVKNKQLDYAIKSFGAVQADYSFLKVYEYDIPVFGCSADGFMDAIIKKNIFIEKK